MQENNKKNFEESIDEFARRHPRLMLSCLCLLTAFDVIGLLYHSDAVSVLYQGF